MNPALEASELSASELEKLIAGKQVDAAAIMATGLWDGRLHVRRNAALALRLLGELPRGEGVMLTIAAKDSDKVVREHCVGALGSVNLPPSETVPALLNALDDPETSVSDAATRSLEQVLGKGEAGVMDLMIHAMVDPRPLVQLTVTDLVIRQGEEAVAPLVQALAHPSQAVRKGARRALRSLGELAVDPLIRAIEDDERRADATLLLKKIPVVGPDNEMRLDELGRSADAAVSEAARDVIGTIRSVARRRREAGESITVEGFYEQVLDPAVLGKKTKGTASPDLIKALGDAREAARINAANALSSVKLADDQRSEVLGALAPLARGESVLARRAAARALTAVGTSEAIVRLLALVSDPDNRTADEAVAGLESLAPTAPREILEALSPELRAVGRKAALSALTNAGKQVVPAVAEVLAQTQRPLARRAAARVLGAIGGDAKGQAAALADALRDDDELVRQEAANALGRIGEATDAVRTALEAAGKDSVLAVRKAASLALDRLGGREPSPKVREPRALPVPDFESAPLDAKTLQKSAKKLDAARVEALLFDGRAQVRRNAATALGVLGKAAEPAVTSLVLSLKDPDSGVRMAAAEAIGTLGVLPEICAPALADALITAPQPLDEALFAALDAYGKKAVEPLLDRLAGRPEKVMPSLGKVVGRAPELYVEALAKAISDRGRTLVARENAVDLLASIGSAAGAAEGALLEALAEGSVPYRTKVIDAIGRVAKPTKKVAETLHAIVAQDTRPSVIAAVRSALRYLKARAR